MKKAIAVCCLMALVAACITVKAPDGTQTTTLDINTVIAITQLTLETAEQGLALWQQAQAELRDRDAPAYEQELAEREARIENLRELLATLFETRAGESEPGG